MMNDKFLLYGTDSKMLECRRCIAELGYYVCCSESELFLSQIKDFDNIILPNPTVKNGFIVGSDITLELIIDSLNEHQNLFCGNVKKVVTDKSVHSYYSVDTFLENNSRLTAQGTLSVILNNVNVDLTVLNICVVGYGRCGKSISELLNKLGIKIKIFTRSESSKISAAKSGLRVADITELEKSISDYDLIINTVPKNIFTDKAIKTLDTDNLYIEIASEPYGFDIKKTDTSQFKYILASALPGKYAPISVGQNIAKTVLEMLKEVNLG